MNVIKTDFDGLVLIEPRVWDDDRGFFFESYNRDMFFSAGIEIEFVQDNHSRSKRNVLRGLHYQTPPHAQDKLVRAVVGEVFDVVVDLRHGSPTFGKSADFTLSAENRRMLLVPKGFAHGFAVVSETAEVLYKCSDFYAPETACGLRWDDPDLAIPWPVTDPIISEQDTQYPNFKDLPACFSYKKSTP